MHDIAPILDAHQHFWLRDRGDYHWMSPSSPKMYRDYMPEDLRPWLQACGVTKTIVVQAAQTVAETEFLLDLAEKTDFIVGVVGWLPLDSMEFPTLLDKYRRNPYFVGLRPMLQDLADDAWVLQPLVVENLTRLADVDLPIDWLTYPRHLPHVLKLIEKVPNLRGILDHLSKPDIRNGVLDPWRDLIQLVAEHPNMYCKVSGMITEADHAAWKLDDIRPYFEHVFAAFGENRLIFGSDWPPCDLAGDYGKVIETLNALLDQCVGPVGRRRIYFENGKKFYNPKEI